jgi:hypothetical protein
VFALQAIENVASVSDATAMSFIQWQFRWVMRVQTIGQWAHSRLAREPEVHLRHFGESALRLSDDASLGRADHLARRGNRAR